jgi:hypothetical protein
MASQWDDIAGFGTQGVQSDMLPYRREKASLDIGENCRPFGSDIKGAGAYSEVVATPQTFSTLFYGRNIEGPASPKRIMVACGNDHIYRWNGDDWLDHTNGPVDDGYGHRWTGGWMQEGFVLSNKLVTRTWRPNTDFSGTNPMVWDGGPDGNGDTWEDLGNWCYVMRPWGPSGEYCFAGDIWEGPEGRRFPARVRWSHPVASGNVPEDWVVRDTNQAGYVDIDDTAGGVREMVPLRDYLVVYKRDSIWLVDYIGPPQEFRFRCVIRNRGVHTTDTVVEFNGVHYVQGSDDIYTFDGAVAKSILWGKVKRQYLSEFDYTKSKTAFTALDPVREEVLFFYVRVGTGSFWPDRVLAYDLNTKTFWFRTFNVDVSHAISTPSIDHQDNSYQAFHAIDQPGSRIIDIEGGNTQDGADIVSVVARDGLYAGPGHAFVQVDEASIGLSTQPGSFRLGGQVSPDAPVTWRDGYSVDPVTDYRTDVRQNDQLISYELTITGTSSWQLSHISLLVQGAGERG